MCNDNAGITLQNILNMYISMCMESYEFTKPRQPRNNILQVGMYVLFKYVLDPLKANAS